MNAFVQFQDALQLVVVTEFAVPQNPPTPPFYAVIDYYDARVVAFRVLHPSIAPDQT